MTQERAYAFAGTTMTVLVGGEETSGRFTVLHVIKPNGSSTPPHSHDTEAELIYPLVGSVGAETEGRVWRFGPGEPFLLPPGRPHRLFNDCGGTVREFLLCAPPIFDRFVAAAGTAVAPRSTPVMMTDQDRQRLIAVAPAFGVRLRHSAAPDGDARELAAPQRESIDALGLRLDVLARLEIGDNEDLVLLRGTIHPGRFVPLHSYIDPQCLFVIDGVLDIYRAESGWTKVHTEEALHMGAGVRHAIRNTGSIPSYILLVTTACMLRFLATIGAPAAGPEPPPPRAEELAAFSHRGGEYGLWIASQDENIAISVRE